jgi:hypothetical protein
MRFGKDKRTEANTYLQNETLVREKEKVKFLRSILLPKYFHLNFFQYPNADYNGISKIWRGN